MTKGLRRISELPGSTYVYCGHEYTSENLHFARWIEPQNTEVAQRSVWAESKRAVRAITIPSRISDELAINPFLRASVGELRDCVRTIIEQCDDEKLKKRFPFDATEAHVVGALRALKDAGAHKRS